MGINVINEQLEYANNAWVGITDYGSTLYLMET